MNVIKSLKLGLVYRGFDAGEKQLFSITTLIWTTYDGHPLLQTEQDLWNTLATELGKELVLDQGVPKPRGEVLVAGKFFAPSGGPVPAQKVSFRLDETEIDKTLYVFGNRYWTRTRTGTWSISDPEPITELEISYTNAFGGSKFAKNPIGKGMDPITLMDGRSAIPLPNIELPKQLIVSKGDRPDPAGFGPLDITWPQRAKKAGTYDKKWLKERFPGFADDMDWTIFNMAPEDQQINGFFRGDEEFYFENMHPEKPSLSGKLPGLRVRCFVTQRQKGEEIFKEIPTRIDTLWFFPHMEKVLMIYRGVVEVADEDASDILHLLLACEGPKDEPRPESHYKKSLEKRLDEETGHLNMLDESDLLPTGEPSFLTEIMASRPETEDIFNKNMDNRMALEKERAIKRLEEQGLDPKEFIKEPEAAPKIDLSNLAEIPAMVQELEKKAEEARKEMEERARKMAEEFGLDMEALREEARKRERRWPKFSARETINRLREFGVEDNTIEARLWEVEEQVNTTLRPAAHYLPQSHKADQSEIEQKRKLVLQAKEEGSSLADVDLAYVDLSGLDLSGIGLSKAYLEGAVLHDTNLENANLSGAILVRADINNANLKNTDLSDANLGHANVAESDFFGSSMSNIILAESRVRNCRLDNCKMDNGDLTKATLEKTSFNNASMSEAMLMETSFDYCDFSNCNLSNCIFLYTKLQHCNFSEADLSAATFVKVPAGNSVFKQADLSKCCITDQSDFSEVDFSGAVLQEANLRGTNLSRARFDKADLSNADLSQCDLKETSFLFSTAKGTQFVKADLTRAQMQYINLMEGSLQKANLLQTNLRGANLYGVDFIRVKVQDADFTGANLKRAFLDRWKEQ